MTIIFRALTFECSLISSRYVYGYTNIYLFIYGLPWWLSGKESACSAGAAERQGFNPWVRKIPGGGHGNPLQYSCLGNPMDRGTWQATVNWISKGQRWLKQLSMHIYRIIILFASLIFPKSQFICLVMEH